ncbi:MAG: CpsD/CapB family tyrosine-protein kinase [Anaerovoracaceae bacterium]
MKLFAAKKRQKRRAEERIMYTINSGGDFHFSEAYKTLRTNLNFMSVNSEYKKILVTSSVPREGKSNVCINLAISLAQSGKKVLLVECDLRKPVMHKYLIMGSRYKGTGGKRAKGLTEVLSGACTYEEVINDLAEDNLYAMFAGAIPPNPAELLGSKKMKDLVETLEQSFDYIIFDTPPTLVVTDACVLSKITDGVLFVVSQNQVKIEESKAAVNNLRSVNANIIGAVLNNFKPEKTHKDSNYYYYNYKYEYK